MLITYGALAVFFAIVIVILQRSFVQDRNFTDYAVGGRSFGSGFQAMSFLNTWYPGAMFTAFGGLAAGAGVIGYYVLSYSLLTVVLMYVMANRVWTWGKQFDLTTQSSLFELRYGSQHVKTLAALIGIVSSFPWLVLGLQALGTMFQYLSLGALSFEVSVAIAVAVMVVRQFWTIRMGMRGVVISDMFQGVVAYGLGTLLIIGLLIWLVQSRGITLATLDSRMFSLPGPGSTEGPLYVFALIFSGALGGWCWPSIFVRLFTASGPRAVKGAAALAVPASLLYCGGLMLVCLLAGAMPGVAAHPEDVWFILTRDAGGVVLLALAGVCVFAASMGSIDGDIQAMGVQIARDIVGSHLKLGHKQMLFAAKGGMFVITLLAAWAATLKLPALFSLAVLSYQGVIQLAVPQFLGIFWQRGNWQGAIAGLLAGSGVAATLELTYSGSLPWAWGLTSGIVGLAVNLVVYLLCAYLFPHKTGERHRVQQLFDAARVTGFTDSPSEVRASLPAAQRTQA